MRFEATTYVTFYFHFDPLTFQYFHKKIYLSVNLNSK
jgi:hypothetical protein